MVSICGRQAASMEALEMDGMWLVSILKLRMYIMLKTLATGLELKSGVRVN